MAKLTKRKDGRYSRQVYLGKDENGARKYKTVFGKTQKEVNEKTAEVKALLGKGINLEQTNDNFKLWADRFTQVKVAQGVGVSQLGNISTHVKHLTPLWNLEIKKINTIDIQNILNNLAIWHNGKAPLSKKTLGQISNTAKQVFDLAIQNRIMDFNPARFVTVPNGAGKQEREPLSGTQQKMVVDTPHRAQLSAMLMMYSGLRRGEATALTWADIDLEQGTIRVNKAVEYIKGQPNLKTTKTEAGIRVVSIPQILVDFLKANKETSFYVLHNPRGEMYTEQAWRTLWRSYMADLNIKYGFGGQINKYANRKKTDGVEQGRVPTVIKTFTPHQLRHTFCTMLYLAGVDVMTARDQMGHSKIQTTMEIYTHLDKQYKRNSMAKLDEYINNASQMQVST